MNIGDKFECDYLPGETLTVCKIYNPRQFTVESEQTGIKFLAAQDLHDGPRLSLADVAMEAKQLRRKEKKIQW